jgi:hypothetical protein
MDEGMLSYILERTIHLSIHFIQNLAELRIVLFRFLSFLAPKLNLRLDIISTVNLSLNEVADLVLSRREICDGLKLHRDSSRAIFF